MNDVVHDAFSVQGDNVGEDVEGIKQEFLWNDKDIKKKFDIMKEANTPLYTGHF